MRDTPPVPAVSPLPGGMAAAGSARKAHPDAGVWVERLLPFGLVLSPPVGLALALGLTLARRSRFARLRSHRHTLVAAGALAALGVASALGAFSPFAAATGLVAMAVLWWLWAVGRFAVDDGPGFVRSIQRATALVGLAALAVAFSGAQLRVPFGSSGPSLTLWGPENKGTVLGLGGNGLGPLLVFGAILGLGRAAYDRRWWARAEGLAVAAVNLAAPLALNVRNALWGGVVGAAALLPLAGPAVVGAVAAVGFAVMRLQPQLWGRMVALLDWQTEQARWGVWKAAWQMIRERPWLGVGPNQFARVHPAYALPESAHLTDPHNIYLRVAAEWGVPAALLFFGWVVGDLAFVWRLRAQPYRWALAAAVIGFLAMGLFDTPLFTLHISGPVLVGLGVAGGAWPGGETGS